jgi:hypothetical protein
MAISTSLSRLSPEQLLWLEELLGDLEGHHSEVSLEDFDAIVASLVTPGDPGDAPKDWTGLVITSMERAVRNGGSEAASLNEALAAAAAIVGPNGALLSSERIATRAVAWRTDQGRTVDTRQTLDYVQFMLREAEHVCRHACGNGMYRLHADKVCSAQCDTKWSHSIPMAALGALCGECFITVAPALDACDFCGTPVS